MSGQASVKSGVTIGFSRSIFESAWDRWEKIGGAVEESFSTLSDELSR